MESSAFFMMSFAIATVTGFTIYYFAKVVSKKKPEKEES